MRVRTLDYTVFKPKKYELTKTVNLQGLNFVSDKEFATITRSFFCSFAGQELLDILR